MGSAYYISPADLEDDANLREDAIMNVQYGKYIKEAQNLKKKMQMLIKIEDADRSQSILPAPRHTTKPEGFKKPMATRAHTSPF